MNIQHVLFTTDLSDESLRPAVAVGALAHRENARLTLLHVLPTLAAIPHGAPLAPPLAEPDLPKRHNVASERLQGLRDELPGDIEVHVEVLDAPFTAQAIAEFVEKNNVDLVAMATHGRSGLKRLGLGSVAEGVLRKVHVPVLAFPPVGGAR